MELILCANAQHARHIGFTAPKLLHRDSDQIMAWWVSLGPERLMGLELSRVTVIDRIQRGLWRRNELEQVMHVLHARLRIPPMLWIEL